MTQYNMHEAKSKLSQLVAQALEGEEVILARDGQPAVKLVPIEGERSPRRGKREWPQILKDCRGDPNFPPFERFEDELLPAPEIEL